MHAADAAADADADVPTVKRPFPPTAHTELSRHDPDDQRIMGYFIV